MASKKEKKQKKKLDKQLAATNLKQPKKTKSSKSAFQTKQLISAALILLITTLSFIPTLDNQYVNWDDDKNFAANENVTTTNQKTFWSNTAKIFKSDVIGNYNPLTIFTFALEQRLFDEKKLPFVRHLNNLLLHLCCTFFVFWIGIRLKLGTEGAILLALLFGIHPMRVESVAWVTERKDVLFGAFYLASLFYYIRGKQDGFRLKDHIYIGLFFFLALLAKIQAVFLPLSFILVDYYLSKEAKLTVKSILTKTPYLIGSLIIGFVNIHFLRLQGSIDEQAYSGITRVFIGSYSLVVYYIKALIPYKLSPLYPYPADLHWTFYASIISFIGTAGLLIWAYRKKWRVWFFGLGFFMVNIFLMLQILGAGQGFLADRFTYIAYLGLFFIFAYYLNQTITRRPQLRVVVLAVCGLILAGYAYLTFQQSKVWQNSDTLWSHVLKYYQNSTVPWGNRANYYRDAKKIPEALSDYGQVIKLKPKNAEAYNSRARLYFNFNNRDSLIKALDNYNKAIELDPSKTEFVVNRGATYAKLGDSNKAIASLNQAEQLQPSFANIYLNRSVIYNQMGNLPLALKDIDKYLSLKANFPDMWYEKGRIHNRMEDPQKGLAAFNQAIGLNGRNGAYYHERAKAHYMLKNIREAKQDIRTSQQLGHKGNPETTERILRTIE